MDGLPLELVVLSGGALAALAVMVTWVARKPLLALCPAAPEAVLRDIAFRLRASGHPVREEPGRLSLRIDSLSALKLHARRGPRGTEVRCEVDATGLGWTLILIFAGIGYLGVIALVLAVVIDLTARGFARREVAPFLAVAPLGAPPPRDARALLVEGLSEAQRLVSEALGYEREARQNAVGLVLMGALVLWASASGAIVVLGSGLGSAVFLIAFVVATAVAGAAATGGVWFVRRRAAGTIEGLEQEEALYRGVLTQEIAGVPVPGAPRAGLELLLRAAGRSVAWRDIRRRRKLFHDPIATFVLFLLGYGSVMLIAIAAFLDILPWEMRLAVGLLGAGFAAWFAWVVRSWRREVREEDSRDRREWEELRRRIEGELWGIRPE